MLRRNPVLVPGLLVMLCLTGCQSRTVTVIDAKGNFISGAKVTGIGLSISAEPVYTYPQGNAKLPNFPNEIIQVMVDKSGFVQGEAFPARDFKTVTVTLMPGKEGPIAWRLAPNDPATAQLLQK